MAYTDYGRGKPDLYIRNIKDRQGTVVSFTGSNITPAWVPGRLELAASLSYEGNPAVYLLSAQGKLIRKLTHHWGIDVSPTWSPDGKELAFVSNYYDRKKLQSASFRQSTAEALFDAIRNFDKATSRSLAKAEIR